MSDIDLSLIIPCYNEELILKDSIKEIFEVLDDTRVNYEIIFVEDFSQDKTRETIEEVISSNPQIAWEIFSLLAKKMARAGEIVEELAFRPLPSRLANLLLGQFEGSQDNYISRVLTLDEMAARIGSTREMVCKILYQFSDKGIIDIHRTKYKIKNRSALENIEKKMK